ncbi:MAG: dihydrodipicolinate synthase family protein [Candidatus Micrarchaeia archaeon]
MHIGKLNGIIIPMIAPFRNGKLDHESLEKIVDFASRIGAKGVFPGSSTGCFPLMSFEEQAALISEVSGIIKGDLAFIPGVGRNSVSETIEMARRAEDAGADTVVVVTPYYIKMDNISLLNYFDKIAGALGSLSIIMYSIPQLTGNNISPDVAFKAAEKHKNVIGVKDSSGDFRNMAGFLARRPEGFLVFQGQDDLLLQSLKLGADGGVCGTANFTSLPTEIYKAHATGDYEKALEMQNRLTELMKLLSGFPFPVGFNFLFSKVMYGNDTVGMIPPMASLNDREGARLYEEAKKFL